MGPRRGFQVDTSCPGFTDAGCQVGYRFECRRLLLWRGGSETEPVVEQPATVVRKQRPPLV